MGRRADVEVFRPASEQQVADAAADEIGDVIALAQPVENLQRIGVNIAARERVLLAWNDPRFDHRAALYQRPSSMTNKPLHINVLRGICLQCYHRRDVPRRVCACRVCRVGNRWLAADSRDPLDRARALYNQRQFEAALTAADEARKLPEQADGADLIAARAYLERFRESRLPRIWSTRASACAASTRPNFRRENASSSSSASAKRCTSKAPLARRRRCSSRCWCRAASLPTRRASACSTGGRARSIRTRVRVRRSSGRRSISACAIEWRWNWPRIRRAPPRRTGLRRRREARAICRRPGTRRKPAWVRAPLTPDRGVALRHDLDELVQKAIVPERARVLGRPPESLRRNGKRSRRCGRSASR